MTYSDMSDDELRLAVAKAQGYKGHPRSPKEAEDLGWTRVFDDLYSGPETIMFSNHLGMPSYNPPFGWKEIRDFPDYARDPAAALALLDSMTYPPEPDGRVISVEYNITRETYRHFDDIDPLDKPLFLVQIMGRNPIHDNDYDATADTLARAACIAWLEWSTPAPLTAAARGCGRWRRRRGNEFAKTFSGVYKRNQSRPPGWRLST